MREQIVVSKIDALLVSPGMETWPSHASVRPEALARFLYSQIASVEGLTYWNCLLVLSCAGSLAAQAFSAPATDDPVHGEQEGRFFHGYYGCYCYLPLYIFIDEHLVCARLRPSNIDASAGSLEEVERIVKRLRFTWPDAKIILRADSGFCRDALMSWCEKNRVGYVFRS